ncbi:hypothetical protein [Streptomyces sp. NPDC017556]|uniref:hypothetical protein n=1 Tax=Streptomyces sp. NPDC017556 TaxID=3365002 RepID=UPI003787FD34
MKFRPLVTVMLSIVVLAGCGAFESSVKKTEKSEAPSMNMQEAADNADKILDETLDAIKPSVKWDRGPSSRSSCTGVPGDSTGRGKVTQRRYVLTIISPERLGSFLGMTERHWKAAGYTITSVRDHKQNPAMFADSPEGFKVSLEIGYKGQAFIEAWSPCVTESEVTDPPLEPLDPDDPAAEGLPYITSEFWSAEGAPPSPRSSS